MSFSSYPEYKDSGVEWLGDVPVHWPISRIKFDSSIKARVGWHGLTSDEFTYEGPYLVTGSDFRGRTVDWDNCYHCTSDRYEQDRNIQLQEGDLLITKDGTIGKLMLIEDLPGKATLNSGIFVVRPFGQDVLTKFYYWMLQSLLLLEFIRFYKTGSTINHLYQETFGNLPYALPSNDEQRLISDFLDHESARIDALIEEQQRLIELLKEKRQAVISHAVTKGLNPDVPMKDSGVEWLGEVPAHWVVRRMRFVAELNPSKTEVRSLSQLSTVTFLPMEAVGEDGQLALEQTRPLGDVLSGYTYFRNGDVTLAKITPCFENGKGAVMRGLENEVGFGTTELTVLRARSDLATGDYLYRVISSEPFRRRGEASMYGAGGQKRVPDDFVRDFAIGWPPFEEQRRIQAFLDHETARIDALVKEGESVINLLKERRSALISAAVTGKIDVRGWQPPAGSSSPTEATATETA